MSPEAKLELAPLIARVSEGADLTAAEAEGAFTTVMSGEATPVAMAALLIALRTKGVVPSEIAGGVRALRRAMRPVASERTHELVDTCGTGGGSVRTFNVSTAAALTAAAAGVRVAKHGNRSFTSQSGSADVLEALGVRIELTPDEMGRVLAETGIVFMFAPLLHPAMRHVGPVRAELAVPTIMNLLGPLTNPAGVTRQLVGVSDPAWRELIARALRELGHRRALVVHGEPGMDELSPAGTTTVSDLRGGRITTYSVIPADLGLEPGGLEALAGGTPQENATLIVDVLEGRRRGSARAFVLANAGPAIYVAGLADSLPEGVAIATEAIDRGLAIRKLAELREASRAGGG